MTGGAKNTQGRGIGLIVLEGVDNVAVASERLSAGCEILVNDILIDLEEDVETGFKVALKKIKEGEKVIKAGVTIGTATKSILTGQIVHFHNMKSDYLRYAKQDRATSNKADGS